MSIHTPGSFSSSSRDPSTSSQHDRSLFDTDIAHATPASSSKLQDSPSSNGSARRGVRHGGFLLDSLTRRSRPFATSKSNGPVKGKERETGKERDEFVETPPRRSLNSQGRSVRSSPLASHVTSVNGEDVGDNRNTSEADSTSLSRRSQPHTQYGSQESRQTDPATLVNLALQLSQSRGRVASARFNPHLAGAGSSGRVVSVGSPSLPLHASQSLRSSTIQQVAGNQTAIPVAPEDTEINPGIPVVNGIGTQHIDSFGPGIATNLDMPSTIQFLPSPQTMIRAERARIALELKYHYRRLLNYVPRHPRRDESRPRAGTVRSESGKGATNPLLSDPPATTGSAYNPLQYARNRKTRYRGQCTLDAESRGWKDLDLVRAWVDQVAKATDDPSSAEKNGRFSLPNFRPDDDAVAANHGVSLESDLLVRPRPKVSLPRNDWTNNAWDLLADIYWVHQGNNRTLIEDRNGDKIYPPPDPVTHRGKSGAKSKSQKINSITPSQLSNTAAYTNHVHAAAAASLDGSSSDESNPPENYDTHERGSASGLDARTKQSRVKRFSKRFSRARVSLSSDDASDEEQKVRTRPWSETFSKKWQGADIPDKKPPRQSVVPQTRASAVRSSFELPDSRRGSREKKRPFSLESDFLRDASDASASRHRVAGTNRFSEIDSTAPSSPAYSGGFPRVNTDSDGRAASAFSYGGNRPSVDLSDRHNEIQRKDFADDPFNEDVPEQQLRKGTRRHRTATLSSPSETSFSAGSDERAFPKFHNRDHDRSLPSPERGELGFHPLKPWKGGALVGRARDLLRRKEFGSDTSDSDAETRRKTTRSPLSRTTTSSSVHGSLNAPTGLETVGEVPQYQGPELPTFRSTRPTGSPSSKDRKPGSVPSWTRSGAAVQRDGDTSSSNPKETSNPAITVSPATAESQSRAGTDERSGSSSIAPSRSASQRRSTNERRGATVTDASGNQWPAKQRNDAPPWPGQDRNGHPPNIIWTGPELRPVKPGIVEKRDYERVESLILSTTLKENFIKRYYELVPTEPTRRLEEIRRYRKDQPPVPRLQEPWILAQCLTSSIDSRSKALDDALRRFSTDTQVELDRRYTEAKDRVQEVLMQKAIVAGDKADELGAEIAGQCTLEVRKLNDDIDFLWRQRRRRSRWLRKIVFTTLEWIVLGIMWALWFLVISFKIVRGTVRGSLSVARWLLWLE